jgi:uncharacterized protein
MDTQISWVDETGRGVPGWQDAADWMRLSAGARTDRFVDPSGSTEVASSPLILTRAEGDLQLKARFHVELRDTFDAVGLMVFDNDHCWAKYALERSPQMEDTVVTVVTNGYSDDCNGPVIDLSEGVWLRLSRMGRAYAFHDSLDGRIWRMRRLFTLGDPATHRVGLTIQAPNGAGLEAEVSDLSLLPVTLEDVRHGE